MCLIHMLDAVAITSLIISVLTATGTLIHQIHLKNCELCFCIKSDCSKTPRTNSPVNESSI